MEILQKLDIDLRNVKTIFRRELANYFNTPIGYIFLGIFVLLVTFGGIVLSGFFIQGASLRATFMSIQAAYIIFVPVVTMRLWSEEHRSGTVEVLLTLPFSNLDLILGKFLAATSFIGIALSTTFIIPAMAYFAGAPDTAVVIGSYLGAWFSGAAYVALGIYISWLTRDQIVAFLVTFLACGWIALLGWAPVQQFLGPAKEILGFFSIFWHSESLAAGLFDTRDFLYYIAFLTFFLYMNSVSMAKFRRGN